MALLCKRLSLLIPAIVTPARRRSSRLGLFILQASSHEPPALVSPFCPETSFSETVEDSFEVNNFSASGLVIVLPVIQSVVVGLSLEALVGLVKVKGPLLIIISGPPIGLFIKSVPPDTCNFGILKPML